MKPFERRTKRVYNTDPLISGCKALVTKIGENYLELSSTVAYPEGGGQEADHGVISNGAVEVNFCDAKKVYTNPVRLENFPSIDANGVIWHYVNDEEKYNLKNFSLGDSVFICIDEDRRARLSISHTASHILYMAIDACRSGAVDHIFGCHIKPDAARFDFYTEKFDVNDILKIEEFCVNIVSSCIDITSRTHKDNDDAKYWECQGFVIPCGGTHVSNTGIIKTMKVRRKGLGAGKERIMCTFEADVPTQVGLMRRGL